MKLVLPLILFTIGVTLAIEDLVCMKNHTVMEISGDAVLSVFIDTDYGPECNISSPKSIQEVAIALFVAQTLNRLEYVPGVTLGLRLYDTCNDRVAVYKQALISAVEMECSAHYDLGILVPERYYQVLEPLGILDILPVNKYAPPNLTLPLIDVLADFVSTRYPTIDLVVTNSRRVLDRFIDVSKEFGLCVKSDKRLDLLSSNGTESVIVALGYYEEIHEWLTDHITYGFDDDKRVWIVLPLDNSYIDDLLPEGSFVIKPEHFLLDVGLDFESPDVSQVPLDAIVRSPHLLSVGKTIVQIAKQLQDIQLRNCPYGTNGCVLPRYEHQRLEPMSNADLYETLRVPATSHSTRYLVFQNIEDTMTEITSYKIDSTSARFRVIAEKDTPKMPRLCTKKLATNCENCINFQVHEDIDDDDEEDDVNLGTLKPNIWVPIFLTIVSCGTLACLVVLAFIVYRFFVEDILDGNPGLTIVLILATILMLQSIIPFCLEDKTMGAQHLNSSKIFVSSLAFGLTFSVMLTRSLFLAFSTGGMFSTHINGYLQGLMLFFMAGVEVAISTMYFILSTSNSAVVMRSLVYIALLSYDIFLLILLFIASIFIAPIQRNYREGLCFFCTTIGLVMCWAVWLTCFCLMSVNMRDVIVCYGILGTACMIIIGILVPRTYFMCSHFTRDKDFINRFEVTDLGPDPRMNNTARQAMDLQSRQPFYEYVNSPGPATIHHQPQQHQISSSQNGSNYYGSPSTAGRLPLRHRSPEPRRTPGYNNYGFRPEMRELDPNAYVIPRLYVEDSDVSRVPQSATVVKSKSSSTTVPTEARYALSRSLLRKKTRGGGTAATPLTKMQQEDDEPPRELCIATEVYVPDRVSPNRLGPDEHFPRRNSNSSQKLSPTHATIREEEAYEMARITRF